MTGARSTFEGRMPRGRRVGAAVSLLAVLVVVLTGCVPAFLAPAKPLSTPTGEDVAEDLRPFYSQVLEWEPCGDGLGCATATAPLDWEDPGEGDVELVNRELAQSMRRAAASAAPARTLTTLDAIQEARERIEGNVQPALALEAMLVTAIRTSTTERGAA